MGSQVRTPMIDQPNLITVDRFNGDAYSSSQAAELALNEAILRAEIGRSYEEFLEIFDRFYADDVEVSSEESRETIRGKERILSFLLNFLAPLHVMVEVAGLSVSIQQAVLPRDTANETHSAWRLDVVGVSGKRCTVKWYAVRRWKGARVVYERHYDHSQIGGPLTLDDLKSDFGRSNFEFQLPS
jgi:hypothetical protein